MLKRLQGFIIGFMVCALFSGITFAATQSAINVAYNNIKLSVRGVIVPTDTEPFVYNNRTFVPVRFVADALGMDVKYNEGTDTVEITDKAVEPVASQMLDEDNGVNLTPPPMPPKLDGIESTFIHKFEDKYYVNVEHVNDKIRPSGYDILWYGDAEKYILIKTVPFTPFGRGVYSLMTPDDQILIDNVYVTTVPKYSSDNIDVDYYINAILPLIK